MNLIGIDVSEVVKVIGSAIDHTFNRLSTTVCRWMRNRRIEQGDSNAVIERLTKPSPRDSAE